MHSAGLTHSGSFQFELLLDVLPRDLPPFRATATVIVASGIDPQLCPGLPALVRADPSHPGRVLLDLPP